jgi:prepilin-type N-terminal cleavage/methylation domain-containing protein
MPFASNGEGGVNDPSDSAGQRGFSLIESMLATLVLTGGVLAVASTSSGVTMMIGQGGRLGAAALLAEGRLESLRATPCAALTGGSTLEGPFVVSWTVAGGGLAREVQLTVTYGNGRTQRSDLYVATISCGI